MPAFRSLLDSPGLRLLWGGGAAISGVFPAAGGGSVRFLFDSSGIERRTEIRRPDRQTEREVTALKIVVVKSPRLLSGILRLIFGIRKEELA